MASRFGRAPSPDEDFVVVEKDAISTGFTAKEIREIEKWLQPTDFLGEASEYNKHLNSHVLGTGNWIQQTETYRKWHDSPNHGSLWTKAIAGAGKSVFAAMLASKLAQAENVPVLFFFFRQIIATNHHPQSLARDFISQLLLHSPILQERMKRHMDDRRSLDNISTNEFWQDLVQALVLLPKVYCVVDALDEMDIDQEAFLQDLVDLGKKKPESIKLFMTSRPLPRIEAILRDASVLQVRLEQQLVDGDIAIYVDYRLNQYPDLNEELRIAIKQAISEKAKGSFLYSRLMMDELLGGHFPHMIPDIQYLQRSLDWLPITLEDMYNGMLLDHSLRSGVPQHLQLTILTWVTHSSRPLRLLEIAAMLDSKSPGKDTKAVVRAACGPLLEILEDETVSVIHHSFTEFLIDTSREGRPAPGSAHPQFPVIVPQATHHALAVSCLDYMTHGSLSGWEIKPKREDHAFYDTPSSAQRGIKMQFPFLDYAINNWYIHVSKLRSLDNDLSLQLDAFTTPDSYNFRAWLDLVWPGHKFEGISRLHVAAWAGMTNYATYLLEQGADGNAVDATGKTSLTWASTKGHTELVALLLKHATDPDVDDWVGMKPLHFAAQANHWEVVKLLLEAGVDPLTPKTKENPGRTCGNSPGTTGQTPLLYATQSGCTESVSEMIPYLNSETLNDSLCTAAISGRADIVDLLLASPDISVDPPEVGDTPLFLAAISLNPRIIQSLLNAGADPLKRFRNDDPDSLSFSFISSGPEEEFLGPTLIHAFAGISQRHCARNSDPENVKACLDLLLGAGCDVNALDGQGKTPLHYSLGDFAISKLLLENGANPMARDKVGNTPLHLVEPKTYGATKGMAKLLLNHGADINARRSSDGRTPLHTMLDTIHGLELGFLLPHVSDWNVTDARGDTVIHIVLEKSYSPQDILGFLLQAGAKPNLKNKSGLVPLHTIKEINTRSKASIELLIKSGADLEAKDNEGRTVLLRVLSGTSHNAEATAILLLELGANLHAIDHHGRGVLQAICARRNGPNAHSFEALLGAGANARQVDNKGNTLLHELAMDYKSGNSEDICSVIKRVLSIGISPEARNNSGQTALHLACSSLPPSLYGDRADPLDLFLGLEIGAIIDIGDHNGIRPIHLAATISEQVVIRLIQHGADATLLTDEGRSILHIAARSRQSNIIGLVLDHLRSINRMDIVDLPDKDDRTPLHDACRSGRLETVALLIAAGADLDAQDNAKSSLLHACSEFTAETAFWKHSESTFANEKVIDARGILREDNSRLHLSESRYGAVSSENDTCQIGEIVSLLLNHGAAIDLMNIQGKFAIDEAADAGCVDIVRILLPLMDAVYAKPLDRAKYGWRGNRKRDSLKDDLLMARSNALPDLLRKRIDTGKPNFGLCNQLLQLGEIDAIHNLPEMGVRFDEVSRSSDDFFTTLARWGYAKLLEKLGSTVNAPWVNGKELTEGPVHQHERIRPYILTAVERALPNIEVVKLLVERFGADVNVRPISSVYHGGEYQLLPGESPLHVLARSFHWWQLGAMKYLLDNGADPELKDSNGQTVLQVALKRNNSRSYTQRQKTKLLLDGGANPNAIDESGNTCLDNAIHDIELIRMLLNAGADVTLGDKSILFTAIASGDVEAVRIMLEAGVDCNSRPKKVETAMNSTRLIHRLPDYEVYPLYYAAQRNMNKSKHNSSSIIKLLLEHGADPWVEFYEKEEKVTVLHEIFRTGGIHESFLELPELDLQRRDASGRNIFLSACFSGGSARAFELYERGSDLLELADDENSGLHYLLSTTDDKSEDFRKIFLLFLERAPELVQHRNRDGFKLFHIAVQKRRQWSTEQLIRTGANTLEKDPGGNTPLHHISPLLFSSEEHWPWFQFFLDLGISVNEKNNAGETPVFGYFRAAAWFPGISKQRKRRFTSLKEAGADVFVRNSEGETLLHLVAKRVYGNRVEEHRNGNDVLESFKFLLSLGLDPMVEDNNQRTALDVAAACGNDKILGLFKRDGKGKLEVEEDDVEDEGDDEEQTSLFGW